MQEIGVKAIWINSEVNETTRTPTLDRLWMADQESLDKWISDTRIQHLKHNGPLLENQRKTGAEALKEKQKLLRNEMFRKGTEQARKILIPGSGPKQGLTMLATDTDGHVATKPGHISKVIENHTFKVLGTPPKVLPQNMPWQDSDMWTAKRAKWSDNLYAEITALQTPADTQRTIGKSKLNSAPGLDGLQYGVLKLFPLEDDKIAKAVDVSNNKPMLTFLSNLSNAILNAKNLPDTLGTSEVVYLY
jgi:hypothetical protein